MIVVEFAKPNIKDIKFWKSTLDNKKTWAITFIFIKITYVAISLKQYSDLCEKGTTYWKK